MLADSPEQAVQAFQAFVRSFQVGGKKYETGNAFAQRAPVLVRYEHDDQLRMRVQHLFHHGNGHGHVAHGGKTDGQDRVLIRAFGHTAQG